MKTVERKWKAVLRVASPGFLLFSPLAPTLVPFPGYSLRRPDASPLSRPSRSIDFPRDPADNVQPSFLDHTHRVFE